MKITLGIATKNRTSDLTHTLMQLKSAGLHCYPIIVVDDGSCPPIPAELLYGFVDAKLVRHETSAGYVARRNEIAKNCGTPYYLSLDDDSHIQLGSLPDLEQFADSLEKWVAVALPINFPDGGSQVRSAQSTPYKCRTFVGCAHLINIKSFLELGGYEPLVTHQGEEIDLAARAFIAGYDVWHFPAVGICHCVTKTARNFDRMAYYGARNKMLFNRLYYRGAVKAKKVMAAIIERALLAVRDKSIHHLLGVWDGARFPVDNWRKPPMTVRGITEWARLPLI